MLHYSGCTFASFIQRDTENLCYTSRVIIRVMLKLLIPNECGYVKFRLEQTFHLSFSCYFLLYRFRYNIPGIWLSPFKYCW